jgi:hypothetical protein
MAGFVALGGIALPAGGAFAGDAIEFNGQLSYETFSRARAQKKAVRITYSPGGTGAAALQLARVSNVVIDGRCNSACAWAFVRSNSACFTSRVSFGFHAAHDPGTGRRLNAATGYWLDSVRPSLRGRLSGLLRTSSLITLSAKEMRRYYADRVCGASKPRTEIATNSVEQKVAQARVEPRAPEAKPVEVAEAKPVEVAEAKPVEAAASAAPASDVWSGAFANAVRFETVTLEEFVALTAPVSIASASMEPVFAAEERPVLLASEAGERIAALAATALHEMDAEAPLDGIMLTAASAAGRAGTKLL